MATLKVGDKEYQIPEMNFAAIERAWPYIEEATEVLHPMKGPSAGLAVFAAALMEKEDFDPKEFGIEDDKIPEYRIHEGVTRYLKKQVRAKDIPHVKDMLLELLKEAGIEFKDSEEGEAAGAPAEVMSPSPETAPDTLPSSSPQDVKEEAGTE